MGALNARGIEVLQQATSAFSKRGGLESFWQETALLHFPERANFTSELTLGEAFASQLYSAEPILFRRDFGNWLGSALRPKGREWFLPKAREEGIDKKPKARAWLEARGKTHRSILYDRLSQFNRAMTLADHDWAAFGNAVTSIEAAIDKTGLRFKNHHLRDCAWKENYDGVVDTMFRRFTKTVSQVCAKAKQEGWDLCPKITEKRGTNPNDPVRLFHITMPLWDYDWQKDKKRYDWVSIYIDLDNEWELSCKEVPEFNYAVDRWFTIDGSPYAFSPCVIASLPDARTIQTMTWSIIEAGEKAVEPPMAAVNEAILGGVGIRAGDITWIDQRYDERTGEAIRAIELGGNPQFGEFLKKGMVENMSQAWYLNKLFLPQDGIERTAYESARLNEEFLRVAQPIIEPAENERNGNMLDLSMDIAMRIGLWGNLKEEMPEELRGRHVDIGYDNPIEDARRLSKTNAFKEMLGIKEASDKVIGPSASASFDGVTAFREAAMGVAPPNWLFDEGETEAKIKEAEESAAAEKAIGAAGAVSQIDKNLAPGAKVQAEERMAA